LSTSRVYPELVTGRDDHFESRRWEVRGGSTMRGEASCNLTDRVLEVPLGDDATSRVVRAHELMHARVSPHDLAWAELFGDISPRALECAEEFRVNALVARLDFPVILLHDGTEKNGGRRLAQAGEWGQAVCFLLAVLGTGAERDYLAGIRAGDPSWLAGLRAVRKRALALLASADSESLGATAPDDLGVPAGYANFTVVLARLVTQTMASRAPVGADELRRFRRSLEPGGRRPPSGRFAELLFDEANGLSLRPRSPGVTRNRPSVSGTVLRFPGRLLTDPQRRGFQCATHPHGGVVVIDQSGSMDIDPDDLSCLMRRAPNAIVAGYSHRPGDAGATPNAWILAQRGGVVAECPSGNVGNGVDGPILEWALAQRGAGEPVVWVTDGQVTDSHDYPDQALTAHCAALVLGRRVTLVRELADVGAALRARPGVRRQPWSSFGRLGREILAMKGL
jgi:hypothetical protein